MTHPCENKCPHYDDECCSTCLIQDDVEGVDLLSALNEVLDEVYGDGQ